MFKFRNLQGLTRSSAKFARSRVGGLRANKFIRNAGIISSGAALGHVFTLVAGRLLTRIYGLEEFGALGLFRSLLSIQV